MARKFQIVPAVQDGVLGWQVYERYVGLRERGCPSVPPARHGFYTSRDAAERVVTHLAGPRYTIEVS